MRVSTLFRTLAAPALFALLCYSAPAQDQSGDVAAAARKAREQQKNAPKPKKVLTNDDIPSVIVPNEPAHSSGETTGKPEGDTPTAAGATKGDKGTKEGPKEDPNGEAAWRKRFQDIHARIATMQREVDVLQRELEKAQVQYYPDPQKALMQQYDRSDIDEKTKKIADKKKELDDLNEQLSDLQDQLRKSGGDPGWAR